MHGCCVVCTRDHIPHRWSSGTVQRTTVRCHVCTPEQSVGKTAPCVTRCPRWCGVAKTLMSPVVTQPSLGKRQFLLALPCLYHVTQQAHSWLCAQDPWKHRLRQRLVPTAQSSFIPNGVKLETTSMPVAGGLEKRTHRTGLPLCAGKRQIPQAHSSTAKLQSFVLRERSQV